MRSPSLPRASSWPALWPALWPDVEFIEVAANGIRFEVATAGAGDRLALCLHGFPEHCYSWRYQLPLLRDLGYRVWAPNLRGYGHTTSPQARSAYTIETLVEDVAALIRTAGAGRVLLLAHDWGGVLAWLLAMRQPGLLSGLVCLNIPHPACFARELRHPAQLLRSWYVLLFQVPGLAEALLGARQAEAIAQMFLRTTRDPARFPPEVLSVYRANALRPGGLHAMMQWYRAMLQGGGWARVTAAGWPRIDLPTLQIWGDADTALSIRTLRDTRRYVPNLSQHVLRGVSHWVQQEAPEEVNRLLTAWLREQAMA